MRIMYYFTRISFNTSSDMKKLARELYQNSYLEHQLLWQLFDSDSKAKRDFLYRQTVEQGQIKYYILSKREPIDKRDIWQTVQFKIYNPKLTEGQKLFFMLRANPVIFSPDKKRKRYDVVLHEKKKMNYNQLPLEKKPPLQKVIQDSCLKWLTARASSNGFVVNEKEVVVDGYRQHKLNKKNIIYSSVDFQGLLTVSEPELLKSSLIKGIGKSKAFGCGLLLIKKYNKN